MRNFVVALILLSIICTITVANAFGVKLALDRVIENTESLDFDMDENTTDELWKTYEKKVEEARTKWKRTVKYVSLSVNHNDIMAANAQFAALAGAAKVKDHVQYGTALSTLKDALDHLRKLAGLDTDTLF